MEQFLFIGVFIAGIAFALIPWALACKRGHPQKGAILALGLASFIIGCVVEMSAPGTGYLLAGGGWIAALVWSLAWKPKKVS